MGGEQGNQSGDSCHSPSGRCCACEFTITRCLLRLLASTRCLICFVKHVAHVMHHIYNQIIQFWMTSNLTPLDQYRSRWGRAMGKCLLGMRSRRVPRRWDGQGVMPAWGIQAIALQSGKGWCSPVARVHFAFPLPLLPLPHSSCWRCHLQHAWVQRASLRNYLTM